VLDCEFAVAVGQSGLIDRTVFGRPGDTLRARDVEEVDMGVDDWDVFGGGG
jgi:hypothetical protein